MSLAVKVEGDKEPTNEGKTDEEVYREAFDHFDTNHNQSIPTEVSKK